MIARKSAIRLELTLTTAVLGLVLSGSAATSWGMGTPASPPPPKESTATPASSQAPPDSAAQAAEIRARAEGYYRKAWKLSEDAKADAKAGKTKDAEKKFAKALKQYDEATKLDPTYFEAWNMVGFCSRKTGDLKRSFDAYDKALALKPDYDEAHEYLGEAYLMKGDIAKAKEQLAWLQEHKSDEAAELQESIEAAEKGKPAEPTTSGSSGW